MPRWIVGLSVTALVACSPQPRPEPPPAKLDAARPWVELRTTASPVTSILGAIRTQSGVEIRVPDALPGRLDVSLHAPWDVALDAVVHAAGLHARWDEEGVEVERVSDGEEPFSCAPRPVPPVELHPSDARVSLDVQDAPLSRVLEQLSRDADVPIHAWEGASEVRVTERFDDVPWRLVLATLKFTYTFEVTKSRAGVVVGPVVCRLVWRFDEPVQLRFVLRAFGAYGCDVVVDSGLERRATVDLTTGGDASSALPQLGEVFGVSVETHRGVTVVGARRCGWGTE